MMKSLMQYTDFRAYLRDWIAERKTEGFPCSNRWFAQKLGFTSAAWLTEVLKGKKNLSKITVNKLSVLFKHSPVEARYFEALVFFNQARNLNERNLYYDQLSGMQKLRNVKTLSQDQYEFYAAWYHSVVRSLIGMYKFTNEYDRLSGMVSPPITAREAEKSVHLLEKLGMVRRGDDGALTLVSSAITSGENVTSLAITNFQLETMRLGQEAIDRHAKETRDISTLTVGISAPTFGKIIELLSDTRKRIVEMANNDSDADRVYQVNLQLFPLSTIDEKKGP